MTEDSDDALEALVEDVLARRRRGESVSVEDLEAAHPTLASRIRRLLPTLLAMEGLAPPRRDGAAPSPGAPERIGGFRLGRELGHGGMGRVFEATAEDDDVVGRGTTVALKLVHARLLGDARRRARFLREARLGEKVEDPHVVRTLHAGTHAGEDGEQPYLVLELVRGRTLRALLDEAGALPERLVRHVGLGVARGLAALHSAGAVHRDVKPENVMLTDREDVKLMDLGAAGLVDPTDRLSRTGEFVGTLLYAAPEQLSGGMTDARTDLFALGLTLHEALSGRPTAGAWVRGAPPPMPAGVSPLLAAVTRALLAVDPARRFQSAADVVEILERGERSTWWKEREREGHETEMRLLGSASSELPLRGREEELARLDEALTRLESGNGSVVLIEGPAGIGKSRLLRTWAARLLRQDIGGRRESRPRVVFCRHPGGGQPVPALAAAFAEHLVGQGLEERLAEHLGESAPLAPRLAAVLRGSDPDALSPEALGAALFHVTCAWASRSPLVIVADDVHEASLVDAASLLPIARMASSLPTLVIVASRALPPDAPAARLAAIPGLERIRLGGLDASEARAVLLDALGPDAAEAHPIQSLIERSEGNPFFLEALASHLRRYRAGGASDLPDSITDVLSRRLALLDGADRELLEIAACTGERFDPLLVADASGRPRLAALRALARLEGAGGLLVSDGMYIRFRPRLVREALLGGLSVASRAAIHLAIGSALEEQRFPVPSGGGTDRERAIRLTEHFLAAARPERAAPHIACAFEVLAARRDFRRLTGLLAAVGDLAGLRRLLSGSALATALLAIGTGDGARHAHPEALDCAREGLAVAEAAGDRERASEAAQLLGTLLRMRGRTQESHVVATEELARAVSERSEIREARARASLAYSLWGLNRPDEAFAESAHALALARRLGDARLEAQVASSRGTSLLALGHLTEAEPLLVSSVEQMKRIGAPGEESVVLRNLSALFHAQARFREAAEAARRAAEMLALSGTDRPQASALVLLARELASMGRYTDSLRRLEQAAALDAGPSEVATGLAVRAEADLARADFAAFEADARRFDVVAQTALVPVAAGIVSILRASCAVWRGETDRVAPLVAEVRAAGAKAARLIDGIGALALGENAEATADVASAEATYDAAISRCEATAWLVALGPLRLARGRTRAARGARTEALADFDFAVQWARAADAGGVLAVALARRATVGGDLAAARLALESGIDRCTVRQRYEARHVLGILLDDPAMRAAALEDARILGAPRPPWATAADPVGSGGLTA